MIQAIDLPTGLFAFRCTVELDGVTVRLRMRWFDREPLQGWSLVVEDADGEPLTIQLMARGGGVVQFDPRDAGAPPGYLLWQGPSEYERADLGRTLRLVYVSP